MHGLMMDFPLTLPALFRRAEQLYADRAIVSRRADGGVERSTYADTLRRARRLAVALRRLGVRPGDRVATLGWNHRRHLEAYFAVPWMGAVLHTLNPRLHPEELGYVMSHAEDGVLLVDASLVPLWEKVRPHSVGVRDVVVMREVPADAAGDASDLLDYDTLLDAEDPAAFAEATPDERDAAAMCYTSGTTGRPKGVVYSHRALVLHAFVGALSGSFGVTGGDVVLPVVPMFHVNAWGLPYTCAVVGAAQVLPGPHLDPASLLALFASERVTFSAGVPTVWLALLSALDATKGTPDAPDLSSLRALGVGGAAPPEAMLLGFLERHGIPMLHGWGMTETSPLGSVNALPPSLRDAPPAEQARFLTRQGPPLPLVEIRARGDAGLVPWDGRTVGELEVRGPWVASGYHESPESAGQWTDDGWFRTGDVVTIDRDGTIAITDRAKDLVKSGGEWISSVALENALMAHPAVAEAAVIAVPHAQWQERPMAVVALRPGQAATPEALRAHLAPHFPAWWLPDSYAFVPQLPRGATGKFLKRALRDRVADGALRGVAPAPAGPGMPDGPPARPDRARTAGQGA